MSRLHRFILLLLLAVAIPLQGFAAAAMTHCGSQAEPAVTTMAADDDMAMSMDADTDEHVAHHASADAKSTHKGSCSACAACCVVAATGVTYTPSFAVPPADVVELPTSRPRVAFLTSGPERPPRAFLA